MVDWTICIFVWVLLPSRRFHPGERSSIHVVARPPNRKCCRQLWYVVFPQLLNVLTFMGGVEMGDGLDGSGDWGCTHRYHPVYELPPPLYSGC